MIALEMSRVSMATFPTNRGTSYPTSRVLKVVCFKLSTFSSLRGLTAPASSLMYFSNTARLTKCNSVRSVIFLTDLMTQRRAFSDSSVFSMCKILSLPS